MHVLVTIHYRCIEYKEIVLLIIFCLLQTSVAHTEEQKPELSNQISVR